MSAKEMMIKKLKNKGLDIAEEQLMDLVDGIFEAAEEMVEMTPNKIDDLLMKALMPKAKKYLKELIDKIDGEED